MAAVGGGGKVGCFIVRARCFFRTRGRWRKACGRAESGWTHLKNILKLLVILTATACVYLDFSEKMPTFANVLIVRLGLTDILTRR